MPWSNGTFTRVSNSFSNPATGAVIDPTHARDLFDDYDAVLNALSSGTGFTPQMYGAVGDGSTDDYAALQAMFTEAAGKTVIIPPGTYRLESGTPLVRSGTTVIGFGGIIHQATIPSGTTISNPGTGEFSGLKIARSAENVTLRGLIIRGPYDGDGAKSAVIAAPGSGYSASFTATGAGGVEATVTTTAGAITGVTITSEGSGMAARGLVSLDLSAGGGSGGSVYVLTQAAKYRSIGVHISGRYDQYFYENENYPGNPSDPLSAVSRNIKIIDCDISGFGQSGILADNIIGFQARGNIIRRCGRDGIRLYGVRRFDIGYNEIDQLGPGFSGEGIAPNLNVYGITATRVYHSPNADGTTTAYPPSSRGTVHHNNINGCYSWKGLDTHGGVDITFHDNTVRNCHIGMGIDKGGFSDEDGYAPPTDIREHHNHFEITSDYPLNPRSAIFLTAHDGTDKNIGLRNKLGPSTIIGYGKDQSEGAVYIGNQRDATLFASTIKDSLRAAVCLRETVEDLVIADGLIIEDVTQSSSGTCRGISCESATVRANVGRIIFKQSLADTLVAFSTVLPDSGYGLTVTQGHTFEGNVTQIVSPGHIQAGIARYIDMLGASGATFQLRGWNTSTEQLQALFTASAGSPPSLGFVSTVTAGGITLQPTTTRGDLIKRGVSNNERLAIGAAGTVLKSDGTDPAWGNVAFSELTGTPTTLAGYGITDAQPLDADLTAIAALSTQSFGRSLLELASAQAGAATLKGRYHLGGSGVAVSHTGDTDETVLATVTVPANAMGANGRLVINLTGQHTNNANAKTYRVRLGGAGGTMFLQYAATSSAGFSGTCIIRNRNATDSQVGKSVGLVGDGVSSTAPVTGTIDTTAAVDLVITGQLANSADSIQLDEFSVELIVP